jgi:hypothetical protein
MAIKVLCLMTISILLAFPSVAQKIKTLPEVTVTSSNKVSETLDKALEKDFEGAVRPVWYKLDRDYLVKFILDDMDHSAVYKKNGYLVYVIAYGHEGDLPDGINEIVTRAYPDFEISSVINVKVEGRDIWLINLEDDKKLIMARVEENEMDEVSNLNKASQ